MGLGGGHARARLSIADVRPVSTCWLGPQAQQKGEKTDGRRAGGKRLVGKAVPSRRTVNSESICRVWASSGAEEI